jgi:hypothetical protein
MNDDAVRTSRLILVPALITLAVTALRLVGELMRWNPALFSREAGGAGAIVGIVWLVPIFGIYFARKLVAAGLGPAGAGRALGMAVLGLALVPAGIFVANALKLPFLGVLPVLAVVSLLAAFVAFRGWPALGRVLLAYGLAARIPVAALMLVAMMANWGTHYELGPPEMPPMGLFTKWLLIGLVPQLTFWIAFTIVVGAIFGSLAAMIVGRARSGGPAVAAAGRA